MSKPTIATLSQDMKYIRESIEKIEHKLENGFMPKTELELRLAEVNKEIADVRLQIIKVETESKRLATEALNKAENLAEAAIAEAKKANWKSHTLTAALSVIMALAITYIFNDIVK